MPEVLWAVIVIGRIEREAALTYFRYVLRYAQDNDISDLTLSGIAKLPQEKKDTLIAHMCAYHDNKIKDLIRPFLLFSKLPAREIWEKYLPPPVPEEDWHVLGQCVMGVFDHQTQEATDCRWVKLMPQVLTGKIKIPYDHAVELLDYPNRGDQRRVRPFIRSAEIAFPVEDKTWANDFWDESYQKTVCFPAKEENVPKEKFSLSHRQIDYIRKELINLFLQTDQNTAIDPKHDTIFGIVLFSVTLLEEQVATNLSRGTLGRIVLRNIAEAYITLAYLLKKDEPDLWKKFRDYGLGQIKLTSLKVDEMKDLPNYIDGVLMKRFSNEDRWEEFTAIDVGNWTKKDLRKLSEEADCKDIYDKFYVWTSTYTHSGWGAIRESVMVICGNILHRMHLIPKLHPEPLRSTLLDAAFLVNAQLDLLEKVYSSFSFRLTDEKKISVFTLVHTLKQVLELRSRESNVIAL